MNQENLVSTSGQLELAKNTHNHKLAMTVAIISWSMLFATLLLGYFVYRFSQTVWPPLGVASVPLLLPNMSLVAVIASSLTLLFATLSLKKNNFKAMRWWNICTLGLGLAYMFSQIKFWKALNELNLFSSSNIFGSILHGFTWIHAGHMMFALLGMTSVIYLLKQDESVLKWSNYFFNIAMFWHFLTIVWLVLYCTLFIF